MTYDLALYPASGPGLGHLMRCYALAEQAVEMKAKVIVDLEEPAMQWPCQVVLRSTGLEARTHIFDRRVLLPDIPIWQIVDRPPAADLSTLRTSGFIYPHFGAHPVMAGIPTLYGEQWMPLRRQFNARRRREKIVGAWASYRHKQPERHTFREIAGSERWWEWAGGLICPPSTIAYEAMALGIPVALHDDHDYPYIANMMIEAGVAVKGDQWKDAQPTEAIDGLGAKRILEALL